MVTKKKAARKSPAKHRSNSGAKQRKQAIVPYLLYRDVPAALDWFAKAFGFTEFGDRFSGPDGRVSHAAMQIGPSGEIFMLGRPGSDYKNPKLLGTRTQMQYINVDAVEKHFARAKKAGAKILEEPNDTFYGDRRYGAEDPEGHQWYFAQHVRDVSTAEMKKAMKARKK